MLREIDLLFKNDSNP